MKINLLLTIVGAGLSYSLIIFHSSLDATEESGLSEDHIAIQVEYSQEANTNSVIQLEYSPEANTNSVIQVEYSQEANTNSVIQLEYSQEANTNSAIQMDSLHVNDVLIIPQLKAYIGDLEEKEGVILLELYKYVDKYIEDYNFPDIQVPVSDNLLIDSLPPETISNLQETVKLMVAAGFEKECRDMYIDSLSYFYNIAS
ncbi:putative exocyst complex component Exo70, cullin repeat-like-containing domain-containing protein [Lupinus albus]|uniref:Putative exocyst complex component Exo70, cullin repeat-like-containing domain-containing protein n=1 Tax=Lupinus albus TaxID=3870 RepID=A0A6A4PWV1_LUPAL|nr:putative exocyst complex component Exo70, cullin repeat-like-containing domain-containing protein [Lupinus albus]